MRTLTTRQHLLEPMPASSTANELRLSTRRLVPASVTYEDGTNEQTGVKRQFATDDIRREPPYGCTDEKTDLRRKSYALDVLAGKTVLLRNCWLCDRLADNEKLAGQQTIRSLTLTRPTESTA